MKKISVVVPCFNEEKNIKITYEILRNILDSLDNYSYEIIFGDNDSTDNSQSLLREIANEDKNVKVIFNNRNFGPESNSFNLLTSSSGDAAIWICCDRQDPPEMIYDFIKEWENGNKVVWGNKTSSNESYIMYHIRSLYYKIINLLSDIPQYKHCFGFGLYDKSVILTLKNIKDPDPIIRHLIPYLGYKPFLLPYKQRIRKNGQSSYNFFRYFDAALNSLVQTSKVPMKFMIYMGIIIGFLSFFIGMIYFVFKLLHWDTFDAGIAPIIILFSFVSSIQMFFMGIIGEYLLAVLGRVSFVKTVIEKERINFDK